MGDTIKEATIKLKLDSKDYEESLRRLDKPAGAAGASSGSAFASAFSSGIMGAKRAVEGMLSSIKSGLGNLTGMRGLGVSELAKHAVTAEDAFRALAFQVQAGSGQIVNMRDLMNTARDSAVKWGVDVDELGASMKKLFEETGRIDVATANMETIATVSRASNIEVEKLAGAAGVLSKKFKVANGDMGEALTTLISASNRGGVKFDELAGRLTMLGAVANTAGLEGKDGFSQLVGMLNFGEEGAKNFRTNMRTVQTLIEEMENKTKRTKMLVQLGISPTSVKGDNFMDTIGAMLQKTGGAKDKLAVAFKNEAQLQFMVDLGEHYKKAFDATTGDIKTKMAAGVAEFKRQIEGSGKSAMSYGQVQDQAKKNMETASAKMAAAIEKMKAAFMRPEVTDAVGKLADALPVFAHYVAEAVDMFVQHPIAGAGVVAAGGALKIGTSAAMSALPTLIRAAFTSGGAAAGQAAAGSLAAGAAPVGATIGSGLLAAAPFAAAAIGVGLAAWQAKSLYDELKKMGNEEVVDSSGKKVQKLGPKEGKTNPIWMKLKNDLGIVSDKEYSQYLTNKTGMVTSTGENEGLNAAQRRTMEHEGMFGLTAAAQGGYEEYARRYGIQIGSGGKHAVALPAPPPPKPPPGRSKEDAALFAEMMAQKTLKVTIDAASIAALQGRMGSGGGESAPGYADRK